MRSKVENLCLKYLETDKMEAEVVKSELDTLKGPQPIHYGFCPLVKLTFKDLAKLTAFAAIFKTKTYFR